jgi:hypothetical protein
MTLACFRWNKGQHMHTSNLWPLQPRSTYRWRGWQDSADTHTRFLGRQATRAYFGDAHIVILKEFTNGKMYGEEGGGGRERLNVSGLVIQTT